MNSAGGLVPSPPLRPRSGSAENKKSLNESSFINYLRDLNPDIFIVIAYKLLPSELFKIPKYGTMNLHASLLPKYRGAAPIQHAILNGESETGITTFIINNKIYESA